MITDPQKAAEYIIPTGGKDRISSRLSWPISASEISRYIGVVPQLEDLRLVFRTKYGQTQLGHWPVAFPVLEASYSNPHLTKDISCWEIGLFALPSSHRRKVKEALATSGLPQIRNWLIDHAKFSGRQSYFRLTALWHSDSEELSFEGHNYKLPAISSRRQHSPA